MYNDRNILYTILRKELWENSSLPYFNQCNFERYLQYKIIHNDLTWEEAITYINLNLDREFYTQIQPVTNPSGIACLVNKYHQLPRDFEPEDLELIQAEFSEEELVLRHKARIAFEAMCMIADTEDIHLKAISTYRSYNYQEKVYLSKKPTEISIEDYRQERDKVSARPGHSEHQTGLAVDINDLEETFELTPEGKWLAKHSYRFGFILRYPKGTERITGYSYEPWHFRYVGLDLAKEVFDSGLTYDEFYCRYHLGDEQRSDNKQ